MLTWVQGDLKRGCVWHLKSRISVASATGQVDVFVMPKIASVRPIAVTLNLQVPTGKKRLRGALAAPGEAESLRSRLVPYWLRSESPTARRTGSLKA